MKESLQAIGTIFNFEVIKDDPEVYIYIDLDINLMVYAQLLIVNGDYGEKCVEFTVINVGLRNDGNENAVLYAIAKSSNISNLLDMDLQTYCQNNEDKELLKSFLIGNCPLKYYSIRRIK